MKLHANARTCPHSRRLAVDRVEREGWTLAAAAEAAGVSVRTISKWRRRYRDGGEQGLLDRCSLACAATHQRAADRADRGATSVADDRGRDRGSALDAALDGVGDLDSDRARQAVAARTARAAQPLREAASRRARPRRCQEAGPNRASRPPRYRPRLRRRSPPPGLRARLGVRPRGNRRRDPPRLCRSPRRREGRDGGRLLAASSRPLRQLRDPRRASDDRQRQRLPLHDPRARLQSVGKSNTCAPGPTGHAPTEKPSASSAHCSEDGPTAPSTATAKNDAEHSTAGSTTTLADDPTAASTAKPRSSAYTRSTGTTSSGPTPSRRS